MSQRFEGTENYVATDDLKVAVNAAIALERPLLIKGEPGTGKTVLAYEVAKALEEWDTNQRIFRSLGGTALRDDELRAMLLKIDFGACYSAQG